MAMLHAQKYSNGGIDKSRLSRQTLPMKAFTRAAFCPLIVMRRWTQP
jgi:hypothetical protein